MRLTCEELSAEGGAPDGRTPIQAKKRRAKTRRLHSHARFPDSDACADACAQKLHPRTALNAPTWLRTLYYRTKSVHFNTSGAPSSSACGLRHPSEKGFLQIRKKGPPSGCRTNHRLIRRQQSLHTQIGKYRLNDLERKPSASLKKFRRHAFRELRALSMNSKGRSPDSTALRSAMPLPVSETEAMYLRGDACRTSRTTPSCVVTFPCAPAPAAR